MATIVDIVTQPQPTPQAPQVRRQHSLFRRVLLLSLLFGLVATACGNGGSTSTDAAPTGTPGANAFLEGEFDTFGGPSFNLADAQNKDVVFWFWAPW